MEKKGRRPLEPWNLHPEFQRRTCSNVIGGWSSSYVVGIQTITSILGSDLYCARLKRYFQWTYRTCGTKDNLRMHKFIIERSYNWLRYHFSSVIESRYSISNYISFCIINSFLTVPIWAKYQFDYFCDRLRVFKIDAMQYWKCSRVYRTLDDHEGTLSKSKPGNDLRDSGFLNCEQGRIWCRVRMELIVG